MVVPVLPIQVTVVLAVAAVAAGNVRPTTVPVAAVDIPEVPGNQVQPQVAAAADRITAVQIKQTQPALDQGMVLSLFKVSVLFH